MAGGGWWGWLDAWEIHTLPWNERDHTHRKIWKYHLRRALAVQGKKCMRHHEDFLIFSSCQMGWIRNWEKKTDREKRESFHQIRRFLKLFLLWVRWKNCQWSLKLILIQDIKMIWWWYVYRGWEKASERKGFLSQTLIYRLLIFTHKQAELNVTNSRQLCRLIKKIYTFSMFCCPIFRICGLVSRCEGRLGAAPDLQGSCRPLCRIRCCFRRSWLSRESGSTRLEHAELLRAQTETGFILPKWRGCGAVFRLIMTRVQITKQSGVLP